MKSIRIACDMFFNESFAQPKVGHLSLIMRHMLFGTSIFHLRVVVCLRVQHKERDDGVFVIYQTQEGLEKNTELT